MGTNRELARIFEEIALILELEEVEWKPRAYRNAANGIENLSEDVRDIYKKGGQEALDEIPGVGKGIAKKIAEYLETGRVTKLQELRKKYPRSISALVTLEGMGPKKVKRLVKELRITSTDSLEKAARQHKIQRLEGFGAKSEEDILNAIRTQKVSKGRMLQDKAMEVAEEIVSYLKKNAPVDRLDYVGSLRRMKETIGDIDILAVSKSGQKVMDVFTKMDGVKSVLAKGTTRSSVVLEEDNIQVDIRVVPESSYAAALIYFTGSKAHNIALRKVAISKRWKLSEYGLFTRQGKKIPFRTEEALYKKLGLSFIPPELRENRGEIEAVKKGKLPDIVALNDIKGDLQTHTIYSDGTRSVEDMVKAAQDMGYEYMAITDHSESARIAGGMDRRKLEKQLKEIEKVSKRHKIKVLKGAEVNILKDGKLDYPDSVLKRLDIVVAAVHSSFKMPKREMTKRIIKALENPYVDILAHPTGRMIGKRKGYDADFERIFEAAAENGKALEINSEPQRLDLNDENILVAKRFNALFCINTDAHDTAGLNMMKYGVGQARRAWLTKKDVVNTWPYNQLKKVFKRIPD